MTDQAQAAADPHPLIAPGSSTEALSQPVACFPHLKEVRPSAEIVVDLTGLYNHVIANSQPGVYGDKNRVPMVLCGKLKVAPWTGKTAERARAEGWPSEGKQRSGSHVAAYGPAVMFDIDGMRVKELAERMAALGVAYIVYTSYSSGEDSRDDKTGVIKAKGRGRLILFLDGTWDADEHSGICRMIDRELLGRVADVGAFNKGQAFYIAGLKQAGQDFHFAGSHGQMLSLKAIRALIPKKKPKQTAEGAAGGTTTAATDEAILQEAREIGALGCVDGEKPWFAMTNSIRRTWPDRPEFALDVADAMSAAAKGYVSRADVADKMKRSDGEKHTTKFDFVQAWGKACAVAIIERAHAAQTPNVVTFPGLQGKKPSKVFNGDELPKSRLGDDIAPGMEPPASLDLLPDNVRRAVLYLARWHRPEVIDGLAAKYPLGDMDAIAGRKREREEEHKRQQVRGREVVAWDASDPVAGVDNVVAGIVRYANKTGALWASGEAIWRRVDGTRSSGVEQFGVVADQPDAIAMTDAAVCRWSVMKKGDSAGEVVIRPFDFMPGTVADKGPNLSRLKITLKKLVRALPHCEAFIDLPAFASLPQSYDDIGRCEPHIVDRPGLDAESGLYLLKQGARFIVPRDLSPGGFEKAVDTAFSLLTDFAYADDVSRLAALFGLLLAGTRGSLQNAPMIATAAGMSGEGSGKNTMSELLTAIATGEDPGQYMLTLGSDTAETNLKAFRHLSERPRSLGLTNIDIGRPFQSMSMTELATSGYIDGRLLYTNKAGKLKCRPLITLNGNGLSFTSAFGRRVAVIKLNRPARDPEGAMVTRSYRFPNLVRHALRHRDEIVAAIMTLVMTYWRACQAEGGMPKIIRPLCADRRSGFEDKGVDFLLHCATWLTQGRYGSAYFTFANHCDMIPGRDDTTRGLDLVEEAMARIGRGDPPPGLVGEVHRLTEIDGDGRRVEVPPRGPVSEQRPATADKITAQFTRQFGEPMPERVELGEIMNSRSKSPHWGPKTLSDWLKSREELTNSSGKALRRKRVGAQMGYWFE